jgi:broad specificity phosphatase PhoE
VRAVFIRHGSTGNAGVPCHDLATIELTERGHEQASAVAASWTEAPALIVTSPYTRTRQTAAPTIARFPGVPVKSGRSKSSPICNRRAGTARAAERMPHLERYWREADPDYCDGEGAESFATCYGAARRRLTACQPCLPPSLVYVFGHGQFIQAARDRRRRPSGRSIRCGRSGAKASRPRSPTRSG